MIKLIPQVLAATDDTSLGKGITGTGIFQNLTSAGDVKTQLGSLLTNIITTITVVGSLAFVIYFFIGTLKWIIAGGDKGKVSEAQTQMTQAAIGLIAIVASFFIVGIVGAVLGIDVLNPFKTLFGTGNPTPGSEGL